MLSSGMARQGSVSAAYLCHLYTYSVCFLTLDMCLKNSWKSFLFPRILTENKTFLINECFDKMNYLPSLKQSPIYLRIFLTIICFIVFVSEIVIKCWNQCQKKLASWRERPELFCSCQCLHMCELRLVGILCLYNRQFIWLIHIMVTQAIAL